MLFRTEVGLAIKRPPAIHETVYATLEADNHREAQQTAIAMASIFHPSTVMAVKSSAELVMDDIFPPEWWESPSDI